MKTKPNRGPGRPAANIVIPNKKFTFADLCEANDVTPLTLRKFLKRDAELGKKSQVVLTDETRDPQATKAANKGLGRKVFVYARRAKVGAKTHKAKTHVAVKIHGNKTDTGTAGYEAQKAALLAPEPAPAVAAPVVAETPAPAPAPAAAPAVAA